MNKFRFLAFLIFLGYLGLSNASSQQLTKDPKAEKILEEMTRKYKGLYSFYAEFDYTLKSPTADMEETYNGSIIVRKNKFRLNLGDQLLVSDGKNMYTYVKSVNEVTVTEYMPTEGEITPTNIYDVWKDGYKYYYQEEVKDGDKTYDVIDLVPEDRNDPYFKIRITIKQGTHTVKAWKIFEKNGNRYTYTVKRFIKNKNLKGGEFTIKKKDYPEATWTDLR